MTTRKSIDVCVRDIQAICLGIVDFPPGEEVLVVL